VSENQRLPAQLEGDEIERRIREIERQASGAQLPARQDDLSTEEQSPRPIDRPGGDESVGNLLQLFAGFGLVLAGLLLYASRLFVWSGFRTAGGTISIGLVFIPFILGVALVAIGGKIGRLVGLALVALTIAALFLGSLDSLRLFFRPTSLLDFLLMVGCVGAGLGLLARGVRRLGGQAGS
jgi:hypothetical protein